MEKTIFEQMGGTYEQQGNYLIPCLTLPAEEEKPIGIWGQRHLRYLKTHRKITYTNLLTSGKLNSYLAESEGVNEQLKVSNAMLWVQKMNNIRNKASEIINAEVIFPD